ncbi:MAG: hypothetical protein HOP11_09595 [Saprospiraceae bacterium]|nr:hypothetical protein [Saprospiraceae bacterium]
MNKSVIRHLLTALSALLGFVPATKVFVPVIVTISEQLDSLYSIAAAATTSLVAIYYSWKYGRSEE